MPFPEPMRRPTLQNRLKSVPKPALAGAALLLAASLVGVVVGFSTCSPQPAFTISLQDQKNEGNAGDMQGGRGDGDEAAAEASAAYEGEDVPARAEASSEPDRIAVYVSGAVANPGVYDLPEGSRVNDALAAAGGMRDDAAADAVNLARKISDGEQIAVPTEDQAASGSFASSADAPSASSGAGGAEKSVVNINTATVEELDSLPGIGPATAQAIIDEREANGPFSSVQDIQRVSGIGEKKFEKLEGSICV